MSEWKEYRLRDVLCNKGYIRGPFGSALKRGDLLCEGIPVYEQQHAIYNKRDFRFYISEDKYNEMKRFTVYPDDIIISCSGTVGEVSLIKKNDPKGIISQALLLLRADNKIISPEFLLYFFKTAKGHNSITSRSSGSVQVNIARREVIEDIPLFIPCIEKQKRIVSILKSLDDKIAVNRRICENLEAQAQALFKHWFIDFAPFKNGQFVESELGMIPEGWRVGTYSDIIQETISGDWGKEKAEGNYTHKVACIRGCDFQDVKMGLRGKTPERFILEKNYQSKHFEDKDVLVEISGGTATVSTGRICPVSQLLIDKYEGDIVCTNFCRLVRPIKGYSSYLYYSWKYKYDHKVMFGYENGTSGIKNFSIKDFSSREPLILPELSALNEFENIIDHIHTQIQNCGSESAKLATLRDSLLPKLMSGQIKV